MMRRVVPVEEVHASIGSDLAIGWRALREHPDALPLVGAQIISSSVYGALTVLFVLIGERLGLCAAGYGYLCRRSAWAACPGSTLRRTSPRNGREPSARWACAHGVRPGGCKLVWRHVAGHVGRGARGPLGARVGRGPGGSAASRG